ncbi:MAG: putative carboxylesterase/lipase family protein [Streblomastix strix]|uniref:Putative carboxylesterase/lipase family protein n=1 Tax=Streblomastix strix TaxID=222440 RepID=A0A5J4VUV4_9EUKA|nr:MAG: putative carboxylesterase/lipase family protein [Streblomastix strix]
MNKVILLLFIVLTYAWPPTVRISDGYPIKGKIKGESAIFHGIPYAAPPVGDLRWRAPQPYIRPNNTLLKAYNKPPACPQELKIRQSEDCLFLNVFVPKSTFKEQNNKNFRAKPVVVYFHYGSFKHHSSIDPPGSYYESFNADGVILVTVNYRLSLIGFFAHPALSIEDPSVKSNFGLYDQREALKWVQRNIRQFGGDPSLVTILGIV